MRGRHVLVLVSLIAAGLVSRPASADDAKDARKQAHKEAKDDRKEAKDHRKEAKDERKGARKELREAVRDAGPDSQAAQDAKAKLVEARRKLKESRQERRAAAKTALKAKWGEDLIKKPAVRAELRLHALRMAKLRQMKRVADAGDKKKLEERIDTLTSKEQARHQARMDALKATNGEDSK